MTNPKWLAVAARRSGEHTWSLGYVFARYQKHEGKTREELAAELKCSMDVLDWLSLCRRPDEARFAEQLHLIEKRFAVDSERLACVLRHVNVSDDTPEEGEGAREQLFQLAARDQSDDETDSSEMARGLLGGGDGRFIGDEDYKAGFNEVLQKTLDYDSWSPDNDIEKWVDEIRANVKVASGKEEAVLDTIRRKVFPELASRTSLPEAGVYKISDNDLRLVFESLLFTGRVEAVNSVVTSHDSLPLGITQIGVAIVGYGGGRATFSQRLFRKELATESDDEVSQALECLDQRHARTGPGRRDGLSMLARRGLRAHAERAILLDKSQAEWRMGQGSPCSIEMLSGSGYATLLKKSLEVLRRLIQEHKKFVYVPSAMQERGYLTLGHALKPGEYALLRTLESDSEHFVQHWHYYDESLRKKVLAFVKECCAQVLIGIFRVSALSAPSIFFAHREHVHRAAHIAMADTLTHPGRAFPMLLNVADASCRVLSPDAFSGLVQDAYTRAGGNFQYLYERYSPLEGRWTGPGAGFTSSSLGW